MYVCNIIAIFDKLIQSGMKVKLLKDHDGNKSGDTIEVTPERANYLVKYGVAKYYKDMVVKPGPVSKPKADKK